MLPRFFKKIFGSSTDRFLKKLHPMVEQINKLEATVEKLSDADLQARTSWLKNRLAKGETLDDILPDAFATVREASKRIMGMRHFDVQLIGGIILHKGMITEMKTGEGKTLVATLPVYLNALSENGVHVVTVNDYLASRDSEWMGRVYKFLGLTVGCIVNNMSDAQRKAAYNADITYGTNNEFGFDYLRDNMKFEIDELVQRPFNFAIVDEVDSILVDEARTPLIISGPTEDSSELYIAVNKIIPLLAPEDFEKDEKARSVTFTETGALRIEKLLKDAGLLEGDKLYDIQNVMLVHHMNQALRAHTLFTRDVDYIVDNNKVIIIDEFTGRMMDGRRYSDGLHQALEAKEGVHIEMENQTLASITFQNYFRLYPKLAGMTGSGKTEEAEFVDIYGLEVIEVPTHRPMVRKDAEDEVYRTNGEKYDAIIQLIRDAMERKQPVLVGTVSIEKSEVLSERLKKANIPHKVLNARYHEQEAYIISQAGSPGSITIATNMAGRGTDIQLGGNVDMRLEIELKDVTDSFKREEIERDVRAEIAADAKIVRDAGGLYVIGTERHESRRIDNQLRGRSGRQGDPGASKFFLSLEDDLMRIFGSDRLDSMLKRLGLEDGEAITHPWVTKALERAQQKVEARNYDIRKHLLKYDDVMNDQRKVIYELRRDLMSAEDAKDMVEDFRNDLLEEIVARYIPLGAYADQWDLHALHEECIRIFGLDLPINQWAQEDGIAEVEIKDRIRKAVHKKMADKEALYGHDLMRAAEKSILLRILDNIWKDHLHGLDHLRQGINLRAYAQRDPLNEYKSEAFSMFEQMLNNLYETVTSVICHLSFSDDFDAQALEQQRKLRDENPLPMQFIHSEPTDEQALPGGIDGNLDGKKTEKTKRRPARLPKKKETKAIAEDQAMRRNDPCPCGSGKRFKHCHGKDS
ncbi:MAG: preprotein translocase subunit SecA [Alphaproteobacteria bacterium]|nr:preprotein translocase subunit SecA [Alphaproteobacteria bacterium]